MHAWKEIGKAQIPVSCKHGRLAHNLLEKVANLISPYVCIILYQRFLRQPKPKKVHCVYCVGLGQLWDVISARGHQSNCYTQFKEIDRKIARILTPKEASMIEESLHPQSTQIKFVMDKIITLLSLVLRHHNVFASFNRSIEHLERESACQCWTNTIYFQYQLHIR